MVSKDQQNESKTKHSKASVERGKKSVKVYKEINKVKKTQWTKSHLQRVKQSLNIKEFEKNTSDYDAKHVILHARKE